MNFTANDKKIIGAKKSVKRIAMTMILALALMISAASAVIASPIATGSQHDGILPGGGSMVGAPTPDQTNDIAPAPGEATDIAPGETTEPPFIAPVKSPVDMTGTEGWPAGPDISCRSAYVIEANSGEVLYAKNANEDRFPASITKIMTALIVLENCPDLNEPVTFSHAAVTDIEEGGFDGRVKEGMVLTVEECLYGLMLDSINECGYALAEHVAGSLENFASMMNEKASSIGCTNSTFRNPHGLNNDEHRTTAHDMALIFWNALQNPDFQRIDSAKTYTVEANDNHGKLNFSMHHKMIKEDSGFTDERVIAGKTGYTSIAKHTLATYAVKDGAQIICITMKEPQGGTVIYDDTKKLLNYAFDNFNLADIGNAADRAVRGLNAASPVPLKCDSGSRIYMPGAGGETTVTFAQAQPGDPEGCMCRMIITASDGAFAVKYIMVDTDFINKDSLAPSVPGTEAPTSEPLTDSEGNLIPENPDSQGESDTQSPDETAEEPTFGSVVLGILKTLMWIVIASLVLLIIYWIIVQIIKSNHRKRALERADRKNRMEKIRSKKGRGTQREMGYRKEKPSDPLDL